MKDVVSLIKKMAQGKAPAPAAQTPEKSPLETLPAAPVGDTPKNPTDQKATPATTPAAPAPTGWKPPWEKPTGSGKPVVVKNPDVVAMQQAIIDFANIASSSDVTSMEGNKEGRQVGDQTRAIPVADNKAILETGGKPDGSMPLEDQKKLNEQTKDDKKTLRGSDAFGNFIIQNYIPKDSHTAKQYLNVDVAGTDKRESASIQPSDLRGIIDTIKRIGTPDVKGERVPDGQWGTRTNNSLHVIGDLVQAMLNFTKDMRVPVQGYTEQNLQDYRSKVPADYKTLKTQADFSNAAKELIPHLRAMTEYFRFLNGKVFNNQQLRKYIDQKQSFTKYDKAVEIPSDIRARGIPGVQFDWIEDPKSNWISLHELSSLENFKKFLIRALPASLGPSTLVKNPEVVKRYLEQVAKKIQTLSTNKPGY